MSNSSITPAERAQGAAARALGRFPAPLQLRLCRQPPLSIDGQTLDPCLQLLLAINRKRTRHGLCEPTPALARERLRREMLIFGGPKPRVGAVRDFEIAGGAGPLRVRHYMPDAQPGRELLVYLHGGGFVIGDLDTHDEACRLLCRHAAVHVLSVDYRLAPEHPFPAALDDTLAALRWAQDNAAALGADPARVTLGGDSAGANLAAVAARLSTRAGRPPAAQMLIYPATDATTTHPSHKLFGRGFFLNLSDREAFYRNYTNGGTNVERDDPRLSPLCASDLGGLPPALVITAGFDLLRDEGEAYAAALRRAGTRARLRRFATLAHGFVNLTGICPSARRALVEIAQEWQKRAVDDSTF